MNYAIILSGGTGTRLGNARPKQYITVANKPVIMYSIEKFERNTNVDKIIIVASDEWKDFIDQLMSEYVITKYIGTALAGKSRQHSILSGLEYAKEHGSDDNDIIVVHDAARPCVSDNIINNCINILDEADGAMPVISVKDTVYMSKDGEYIDTLLNRDNIYAGQAPEGFRFGKYYKANTTLTEEQLLSTRGSSEVAYKAGMKVKLFNGEETNYKITTIDDLYKFEKECINL